MSSANVRTEGLDLEKGVDVGPGLRHEPCIRPRSMREAWIPHYRLSMRDLGRHLVRSDLRSLGLRDVL